MIVGIATAVTGIFYWMDHRPRPGAIQNVFPLGDGTAILVRATLGKNNNHSRQIVESYTQRAGGLWTALVPSALAATAHWGKDNSLVAVQTQTTQYWVFDWKRGKKMGVWNLIPDFDGSSLEEKKTQENSSYKQAQLLFSTSGAFALGVVAGPPTSVPIRSYVSLFDTKTGKLLQQQPLAQSIDNVHRMGDSFLLTGKSDKGWYAQWWTIRGTWGPRMRFDAMPCPMNKNAFVGFHNGAYRRYYRLPEVSTDVSTEASTGASTIERIPGRPEVCLPLIPQYDFTTDIRHGVVTNEGIYGHFAAEEKAVFYSGDWRRMRSVVTSGGQLYATQFVRGNTDTEEITTKDAYGTRVGQRLFYKWEHNQFGLLDRMRIDSKARLIATNNGWLIATDKDISYLPVGNRAGAKYRCRIQKRQLTPKTSLLENAVPDAHGLWVFVGTTLDYVTASGITESRAGLLTCQ